MRVATARADGDLGLCLDARLRVRAEARRFSCRIPQEENESRVISREVLRLYIRPGLGSTT
jgi:hypothetical protein